ncbi:TPM domain-containing protein [Solidesulfovibrio sp.]|uniref:TPM domain-containing protein n=1 Tax=Solidesulfovibrio sp. TaxID=2910990 RepID=UPI002611076C|nr:TPM domain-containing protein [Solidesulfovibrio sp.]
MRRFFFSPRGGRPLERLARGALLAGVFLLVVVAYQRHFNAVIEKARTKGTVADATGVLDAADRDLVRDLAGALRSRFGLELRLRLGGAPPDDVVPGANTALVYADPDCRASRAILAPLAVSALPPGFAEDLGREHLDAACREGRLREGALAAVGLLVDALDAAAGRGKGERHD